MKIKYLIACCCFYSLPVMAQENIVPIAGKSVVFSLNDTNYVRIVSGLVVNSGYQLRGVESFKLVGNKTQIAEWGLNSSKPLMIITLEKTETEDKIDKFLFSNKSFIDNYKYPWTIQLPIAINGKLLTLKEKAAALSAIDLKKIKKENIKYIPAKTSLVLEGDAPFGIINIELKDK